MKKILTVLSLVVSGAVMAGSTSSDTFSSRGCLFDQDAEICVGDKVLLKPSSPPKFEYEVAGYDWDTNEVYVKGGGSNRYWRHAQAVYQTQWSSNRYEKGDKVILKKTAPGSERFKFEILGFNTYSQQYLLMGASETYLRKAKGIKRVVNNNSNSGRQGFRRRGCLNVQHVYACVGDTAYLKPSLPPKFQYEILGYDVDTDEVFLKGGGQNRYWKSIKAIYLEDTPSNRIQAGDKVLLKKTARGSERFRFEVLGYNAFTRDYLLMGASETYLRKGRGIRKRSVRR